MLQARNVHKYYGSLHVLKGIDFELQKGEIVSLVGSSGAGKSTLLQILGTLDRPDSGEVLFLGKNITNKSERRKAAFRNESLGFVFQFHHLLPEFSALENACMPAFISGKPQQEVMKWGKELLVKLGLGDRLDHKPSQLSGGEKQRVAVARALINKPLLILADEPTGNLDSQNSLELYSLLFEFTRNMELGVVIATHDVSLASRADRCCKIQDGLIVQSTKS